MKYRTTSLICAILFGLLATAAARQDASDDKQTATTRAASTQAATTQADEKLELKNLFPKKGLFGPSARSMAFSHDGKFAAYLYHPYIERRHGNDLWIYDPASGETKRITAVSVMSRFQADTRKVKEDRIKKAKKAGKKKGKADADKKSHDDDAEEKSDKTDEEGDDAKKEDVKKDDDELADKVGEKDADDEKAPRYTGVSS